MLQKLEAAGCKVEKSFINHKECEKEVLGGFMVPDGVRARLCLLQPMAFASVRTSAVDCPQHSALTVREGGRWCCAEIQSPPAKFPIR
jgi:hypothetical protein